MVTICPIRGASCTPRKLGSRVGKGDKSQWLRSPNSRVAWTWEGHKTQAQPSLHLWGLRECLSLSGLDQGGVCRPGPASDGSWRSNLEPEQCVPWVETGPAGLRQYEHMPMLFVCSIPPSPQRYWTSEPKKKKCPPPSPLCQGGKQTLKRPANRRS